MTHRCNAMVLPPAFKSYISSHVKPSNGLQEASRCLREYHSSDRIRELVVHLHKVCMVEGREQRWVGMGKIDIKRG